MAVIIKLKIGTEIAKNSASDMEDIGKLTLNRVSKLTSVNKFVIEIMKPYLGSRILEVGAGIGNLTPWFLVKELLVSIDISDHYVEMLRGKFGKYPNFFALKHDIAEDSASELEKYNLDTVVCVNVLEHIFDDQKALANMCAILKAGGRLILLVPALKFLYGSLDRALRHYRRYEKKELISRILSLGYAVEKVSYLHLLGIGGWFLNSRILKRQILPSSHLRIYNSFFPLFKFIEQNGGPPIGQSLLVIATKPLCSCVGFTE